VYVCKCESLGMCVFAIVWFVMCGCVWEFVLFVCSAFMDVCFVCAWCVYVMCKFVFCVRQVFVCDL